MSVIALVGCTGNAGGGALGGKANNTSSSGPVTLVVPTSQAPWNPGYAAVIAQYEKDTGNTVDLRPFPNPDVTTQEINDFQGGRHVFDVYQIDEPVNVQFTTNKWIQPLTKIDPSFKLDSAQFTYHNLPYWDAKKGVNAAGGTLMSVPLNGNVEIFQYRADIYKKLGLKAPTTWNAVLSNAKAAKASGDVKYGNVVRVQGVPGTASVSFEYQSVLFGEGGSWFKNEGTDWTPQLDSAAALKAATTLHDLAALGPAATTTLGQAQASSTMQAGDAAQTWAVVAIAPQLESQSNSSVAGRMAYATLPKAPNGVVRASGGVWSLGVPAGLSKARSEAALGFIKYVTSKKAQTIFAENGGIPIRGDYDASKLSPAIQQALQAAQKSADGAIGDFRYTWGTDMLNITEPALGQIAAGTISPSDGLAKMQSQLTNLMKKNNLPMGK